MKIKKEITEKDFAKHICVSGIWKDTVKISIETDMPYGNKLENEIIHSFEHLLNFIDKLATN